MSSQLERICGRYPGDDDSIVLEFLEMFEQKNKDYGDSAADVLGPAGQFADIWRKIAKLKRSLWDGESLVGEQPEEILMDLIGHCFLTIDMLRRGKAEAPGARVRLEDLK